MEQPSKGAHLNARATAQTLSRHANNKLLSGITEKRLPHHWEIERVNPDDATTVRSW